MNIEDRLGKFLVNALREEPLEIYYALKENALKNSIPEHFSEELKAEKVKEYELFQSLTENQLSQLDRLIKAIVDHTAFSVLRETQEAMDECNGKEKIKLTIEGENATELELLSGSLFGEYLLWTDKFSKYGGVTF